MYLVFLWHTPSECWHFPHTPYILLDLNLSIYLGAANVNYNVLLTSKPTCSLLVYRGKVIDFHILTWCPTTLLWLLIHLGVFVCLFFWIFCIFNLVICEWFYFFFPIHIPFISFSCFTTLSKRRGGASLSSTWPSNGERVQGLHTEPHPQPLLILTWGSC